MNGECLEKMRRMPENTIDSIVTDPPYGLKFMGKRWDYKVPSVEIWEECLRVLKPGGYLLCFAGTRTHHRMAVNIEDAGFEIRDMIAWVYGSGFPKSHNISKAIDKMAGAERECVGRGKKNGGASNGHKSWSVGYACETNEYDITAPATPEAQQWDGWGTALKPALEPITIARKPLTEKTVAANILKWGTGGINIDASRVETSEIIKDNEKIRVHGVCYSKIAKRFGGNGNGTINPQGRFPANLIHDGSEEVKALFPETKSGTILPHHKTRESENNCMNGKNYARTGKTSIGDNGSAVRFFYCAKASKKDRDEGLDATKNNHPTVKPTALMRYLVRLVTPPDGTVLDPFMGSGTTGKACRLEGFSFTGIELEQASYEIAKARVLQEKVLLN